MIPGGERSNPHAARIPADDRPAGWYANGVPISPTSGGRARLLVIALLALQLLGNAIWCALDRAPLGYEVPEHVLLVQRSADALAGVAAGERAVGATISELRSAFGHRGWLLHLLAALPLAAGLPLGAWQAIVPPLLGGLAMAVLVWCTFRLASELADDELAGAMAACSVLLLAPVWGFARKFGVDLPLAAAVAWLALELCRQPLWDAPWRAIRLGLLVGALCLIKAQLALWAAVLYLPLAWRAAGGGVSAGQIGATTLRLAIGLLLGSALFWLGLVGELWHDVGWSASGPHSAAGSRWGVEALAFIPHAVLAWLGPAIGPLTLLGLLLFLRWQPPQRRGGQRLDARALTQACVLAIIGWTLYPIRWERYVLPALPLLIVLSSCGLTTLRGRARWGLAAAAWLIAIAMQLQASLTGQPWLLPPCEPRVLCHPPDALDWATPIGELARAVHDSDIPRRPLTAIVPRLNPRERWHPDHSTWLEILLRHELGALPIRRAETARDPDDMARFERDRDRLQLLVLISDAGQTPSASQLPSYRRLGVWPLPSERARGRTLELSAWRR